MSGKTRYIPSETALSDITCDDNGAYNKTNKVKHDYYVAVDEGGVQAVKWVHKSKDGYFYKKRVSQRYIDVVALQKMCTHWTDIIGIAKLCLG